VLAVMDRVLAAAASVPSVSAVGVTTTSPVPPTPAGWGCAPPGRRPDTFATSRIVTDGYFETLGVRLLRGRLFGPQDRPRPRGRGGQRVLRTLHFPVATARGALPADLQAGRGDFHRGGRGARRAVGPIDRSARGLLHPVAPERVADCRSRRGPELPGRGGHPRAPPDRRRGRRGLPSVPSVDAGDARGQPAVFGAVSGVAARCVRQLRDAPRAIGSSASSLRRRRAHDDWASASPRSPPARDPRRARRRCAAVLGPRGGRPGLGLVGGACGGLLFESRGFEWRCSPRWRRCWSPPSSRSWVLRGARPTGTLGRPPRGVSPGALP
jgi:hypothetical protein